MIVTAHGRTKDDCHTALVRHIRSAEGEGLAIGQQKIKKVGSEWVGQVEVVSTRRNLWDAGLDLPLSHSA